MPNEIVLSPHEITLLCRITCGEDFDCNNADNYAVARLMREHLVRLDSDSGEWITTRRGLEMVAKHLESIPDCWLNTLAIQIKRGQR